MEIFILLTILVYILFQRYYNKYNNLKNQMKIFIFVVLETMKDRKLTVSEKELIMKEYTKMLHDITPLTNNLSVSQEQKTTYEDTKNKIKEIKRG